MNLKVQMFQSETQLAHPILSAGDHRPRSILVVEDEASLQTVLNRVFRKMDVDIEVSWVRSAEAAMWILKGRTFDLVISDYYLEGRLNGLNVWSYCRGKHPDIPVFVMSSLSTQAFVDLTLGLPEKPAFLHKPFSATDFQSFVRAYLYGTSLNERSTDGIE